MPPVTASSSLLFRMRASGRTTATTSSCSVRMASDGRFAILLIDCSSCENCDGYWSLQGELGSTPLRVPSCGGSPGQARRVESIGNASGARQRKARRCACGDFADPAVLHQEHALGAPDQGRTVRNDDAGDGHLLDQIGDRFLRGFVEIRRALVEKEQARLAIES